MRLKSCVLLILLPVFPSCEGKPSWDEDTISEAPPGTSIRPCSDFSVHCKIYWREFGSIEGDQAPAGLEPVGGLPAVDSKHRIYVAGASRGVLVVWDSTGNVVDTIGRPGKGPGELNGMPVAMIAAGDTLHIRDDAGSWSVYSPDRHFMKKKTDVALPIPTFLALTSGGHMIDAWGDPLFRIIKPDGEDSISFGSPGPEENMPRRIVGVGHRPGRFWAVPTHRLVLTEWGLDGTRHRRIRPSNTSFPEQPADDYWDSRKEGPPPAFITHLAEDPQGFLWVRALLPDDEYLSSNPNDEELVVEQADQAYDILIEVIDPKEEVVVASVITDTMRDGLGGILSGPVGFKVWQDELGFQYFSFGELILGDSLRARE